jgi:GLPGLI family protein
MIKKFSIILLFIQVLVLKAQDFKGKAIYQSQTKFDIELDSTQMDKERMDLFKQMMKNQMEKKYELTFNKTQSIYKDEEKLEQPGRGGFRFGGFSQGILYKNIKEQRYSRQLESFSKEFLIKDSLPKYDWKMEGDSKMIGEHLCFKATTTKEVTNIKFGPPRPPKEGDEKKSESENKAPEEPKTINITAWYTPEIPINNGPSDYYGLPGLILEVNEEKTNYLCTEIVMNAKDGAEITEPDKGKVVTQKEFEKIIEEKIKEMQEMYGGQERKGEGGGGGRMIIRM